jgi:hypothetical protein
VSGPFPGASYVDPLLLLGWYGRQGEVDELRAELEQLRQELAGTQGMAFGLTEGLFQEGIKLERLQAALRRITETYEQPQALTPEVMREIALNALAEVAALVEGELG